MKARHNWLRLLVWGIIMVAGVGFLAWNGWDLERVLGHLPSAHPGWFFLAMSVLPLAGFPIAIFYLYAGGTYGFWIGWLLCLLALGANMTASYALGRFLLRRPLVDWLTRRGYQLPDLARLNQFRFTFLLRTIPGPPFPVQNYLLAVSGIPFALYWSVSIMTQGTIAAGMVSIGHYTALPRTRVYVLMGLVLLSVLLLSRRWIRRKSAAERNTGVTGASPPARERP